MNLANPTKITLLTFTVVLMTGQLWAQGLSRYSIKLPGVISYELNLPSLVASAIDPTLRKESKSQIS